MLARRTDNKDTSKEKKTHLLPAFVECISVISTITGFPGVVGGNWRWMYNMHAGLVAFDLSEKSGNRYVFSEISRRRRPYRLRPVGGGRISRTKNSK